MGDDLSQIALLSHAFEFVDKYDGDSLVSRRGYHSDSVLALGRFDTDISK